MAMLRKPGRRIREVLDCGSLLPLRVARPVVEKAAESCRSTRHWRATEAASVFSALAFYARLTQFAASSLSTN
jgi:hypothetical protein